MAYSPEQLMQLLQKNKTSLDDEYYPSVDYGVNRSPAITQEQVTESTVPAPDVSMTELNADPNKAYLLRMLSQKDPAQEALERKMLQEVDAQAKREQEGVDLQKNIMANQLQNMPVRADYSILSQMAKDLSGRDVGYRPPGMSPEEQQQQVFKNAGAIQSMEGNLGKAKLNELKALLYAKQDQEKMKLMMMAAGGKESRQDKSILASQEKDLKKVYEKISGQVADVDSAYNSINSALTPDEKGEVDIRRINSVVAQIRGLIGEKGVMTDRDAARQLTEDIDTTLANISAKFGDKGKISANDPAIRAIAENVNSAVNASSAAMDRKLDSVYNTWSKGFSAGLYDKGMYGEAAHKEYKDRLGKIKPPSKKEVASNKNLPPQSAIQEEMKRRGLIK